MEVINEFNESIFNGAVMVKFDWAGVNKFERENQYNFCLDLFYPPSTYWESIRKF